MIDQESPGSLEFVRSDGLHIQGLAGVGSEKVVLKGLLPTATNFPSTMRVASMRVC
jgi:hypothetical protein